MKKTFYVPITALLLQLVSACSTATFSGTNPSRATVPPAEKPPAQISCKIDPESVRPGEKAELSIDTVDFSGDLFQTIKSPDGEAAAKLVYKGGSYVLEDQTANIITGTKEGAYLVELRKVSGQEVPDATCSLAVTVVPIVNPPPPPPLCKPSQISVGADIAFLIDNSNSNAVTDCPSSKEAGTFNGVTVYECQKETNREIAVKAAFDLLADIAAKESNNPKALSKLAIASFPSSSDYVNGWTDQSNGWLEVNAAGKSKLDAVMAFSRKPSGLTPYLGAFTGAEQAFDKTAADGRAKVAVLVTDGEPTDSDPSAIEAKADALRAAGVKVITINVTGSESRATRIGKHTSMMENIDNKRLAQTGKHWFAAIYTSFSDYVTALVGNGTKPGLVSKISTQTDANCKDSDVGLCAREVYEVQKSDALKAAFLHVINTQAIGCEG